MTEPELVALLSQAEDDAATYNGEFSADNTKYLAAYLGNKTGEFSAIPNQSSVVSTDIADVVEADMPSLARIFLGSGDVVTFQPNTESKVEIQEAEEKTKYVNWIVRSQPESFNIIHNWLKDAEIQKNGVVKYFIEEQKEVEMVEYEGVDAEEVQGIIESLKGSKVDKVKVEVSEQEEVEVMGATPNDAATFDIKFRVTTEKQKVCILNVPPELFLITRNARSLDDAELVGDRVRKTRGELLSEGFDRELIEQLSTVDEEDNRNSNLDTIRNQDQGGSNYDNTINNWASQTVEISDLYVKVDFDGDGIAERRHIMLSGNKVLINEYFNHVPYASLSAILMPHKAIGRSRAEITYPYQLQKTALQRGINDNIYMVNNPRNVVHPDVDLDDMLTVRTNGVIRLEEDTQILPGNAVFPLSIPYIGQQALQVIQYVDSTRAQATGSLLANQGLEADKLNQETATRFNGVKDSSDAKIELIARNYGETGFRKLYEGIAWLVSRYQNTETEFRVLGKALTVNPKAWKYSHYVQSNVGLGAGDNEKSMETLQGLYGIQQSLIQQGSTLADEKDVYNTLSRIVQGAGFPRVSEFFNDPEENTETLKAENEILNKMVVQLQEQAEAMQNPLAEAEQIKQEAFLVKAQSDAQIKVAQLQSDNEQFQAKLMADSKKASEDLALKLTELELKAGQDLNGAMQDNMLVFDPATGDFVNAPS
tara:strand:+ start:2181 stop:4304 length:2124 start_codon:yes stop_codon:yes gene_type:complete